MYTLSRSVSGIFLASVLFLCSGSAIASLANAQVIEIRKNCSSLSAPGHYPDYQAIPRYSIESREYSQLRPAILELRVSASAEAFNSGSMTRLACQLASEFKGENRVDALIFDNRKAARSLAPGFSDQRHYGTYLWHLKGHYVLDRQKGEEYIEFVIPNLQDDLLTLRRVKVWIDMAKSQ